MLSTPYKNILISMHKNISLLITELSKDSKELLFFEKLINLLNPQTYMIFSDNVKIAISNRLPVLHTFYFRHLFFKKLALTNQKTMDTMGHMVHKYGTYVVLDHNSAYNEDNIEKFLEYLKGEQLWP